MELIVKPTGLCNFACNFCLSGKMASNIKHTTHVPQKLKDLISVLHPNCIIVNGGDPLLSGPTYFEELLAASDSNTEIAIVTNLKAFWLAPEKWTNVLRNPRISVTTSFQYGTGRKWDPNTTYDEEKFREVCKVFKQNVGYVPMFIAVITKENEDRALDHLLLAKELGTTCKLNPVLPLGISDESYPKYKMIDIWFEAKKRGLDKYMNADIQFFNGGCSFNTGLMCATTIRVFWEDINDNVHYSACDNCSTLGDSIPLEIEQPIPKKMKLDPHTFINGKKCLTCKLCRFCNACKAMRDANRNDPNYCVEMKKREQDILDSGWLI